MKHFFFIIFFLFSSIIYAQSESPVNRQLRSEELVLAGVMILEGVTTDSATYKKEQYIKLLEQSDITHNQFQLWLSDLREDPDSWFETLELIEAHLQ